MRDEVKAAGYGGGTRGAKSARIRGPLLRFAAVAFWLAVWQGISLWVAAPLVLPSPLLTAGRLLRLLAEPAFWVSTGFSLLRILAGFLCAVLAGSALGALTAVSPAAERLLQPIRSMIKATPVASFILLVVLWMRSYFVPAFMAFLMVLPLIWNNVREGVRNADAQLLEMAGLYRLKRAKKLRLIYLPSVMPYLLSACATGLGFAWKAGVAAEVLARTANSIGKNLIESKSTLETADMFAWTAVVVLLSIALESGMVRLLRAIRNRGEGRAA